jgi:hypothetical protein
MLMNAATSARAVQYVGLAMVVAGAILMWIGTTSIPLFVFYVVLMLVGIFAFAQGKKMYEKTLG